MYGHNFIMGVCIQICTCGDHTGLLVSVSRFLQPKWLHSAEKPQQEVTQDLDLVSDLSMAVASV